MPVRAQDNLHFLAVPLKSDMGSAYLPARLSAEDYPGVIGVDAASEGRPRARPTITGCPS